MSRLGYGFCPKITDQNRNWSVRTGFSLILVLFFKILFGYFLGKNRTEPKMITSSLNPHRSGTLPSLNTMCLTPYQIQSSWVCHVTKLKHHRSTTVPGLTHIGLAP
jgi:hypothetical protein